MNFSCAGGGKSGVIRKCVFVRYVSYMNYNYIVIKSQPPNQVVTQQRLGCVRGIVAFRDLGESR